MDKKYCNGCGKLFSEWELNDGQCKACDKKDEQDIDNYLKERIGDVDKLKAEVGFWKTRFDSLASEIKEYFDFLSEKYSIKSYEDFTCEHHRKIAQLIKFFESEHK